MGDYNDNGSYLKALEDINLIQSVEMVDQKPARSARSNPVTYLKAYDGIRGYSHHSPRQNAEPQARHFSFNIDGGRCDNCQGEGKVTIEMQFLPDVELTYKVCGGKRFKNTSWKLLIGIKTSTMCST